MEKEICDLSSALENQQTASKGIYINFEVV